MLSETTSEKLILESARGELAERGILGLRVASVARNAHCSITNIYRYFGDRDGLLARVLGDMYEEITLRAVENFMDQIRQRPVITMSDIAKAVPFPTSPAEIRIQMFRMQILATAVENDHLRQRLQTISYQRAILWKECFEEIESKLASGETFDRQVFRVMLANYAPFYNELLGDMKVTKEEFQQFVENKLRSS